MSDTLPSELKAEHIGKIVTVQIFRRTENDGDTLEPESLEKHVGILEGFWFDRSSLHIRIKGLPMSTSSRRRHYVEVHVKE